MQSRILQALDAISCQLSNMTRKQGKAPRKLGDQFQPDYVKKAKEKANRDKHGEPSAAKQEDIKELRNFWETYNDKVKKVNSGD